MTTVDNSRVDYVLDEDDDVEDEDDEDEDVETWQVSHPAHFP